MSINRDKFGALLFLCLALIYGFYVDDIPLLFGDEDAPFNAQTLPNALAWILGLVSFIQLVMPANQEAGNLSAAFRGLKWGRVVQLGVLMVFYGFTIRYLGFLISTTIFLVGGFAVLGERRIKVLLGASIPVVFIFWYLLTQLMGIYLAPGDIFEMLG
ncbi:tripartite tricarboxylate transporter TctB family protein [Thalassospira sp. GB04J01]|jgi:putative tricarboxylic transport membrane protein|uniref:tripartite tricarboxylate transporter TctB family protein n=1 Tax=Thalassospira sp. GB04J01 TaxID=1485225 RepID=UPI000C9D1C68|nr:tripartite tricarboxylate transporter TctB family protein [Thalassospira sp. GB04J01]|tara:strand:- start:106890 stop:107363 length:474 start_codon:yes stop_codon:yes gene_type:complete